MGRATRARPRAALAVVIATFVSALAAVAPAAADVGALTHRGCLTSATALGICTPLAGRVLDGLGDAVVSSDGGHVYAAAKAGDAIATFVRDQSSGALAYGGCVGSNSDLVGCALLPGAVPGGDGTPLSGADGLGVSPDGRSVYATSGDHALIRFDRDAATGALSYGGCISGRSGSPCVHLPGSTSDAGGTALAGPRPPVVSADGTDVYVPARLSDAVSRFTRDPATGALAYAGCVSSNSAAACSHLFGATSGGNGTGLNSPNEIALTGDGRSIYAIAIAGDAITHFAVGASGALTYAGCVTSNSDIANCTKIPGATGEGTGTPLDRAMSLAVGPGDRRVYASGRDDAVAAFDRDLSTGALTFASCVTANTTIAGCAVTAGATVDGAGSGLNGPRSIVASPAGNDLYVAAEYDSAVVRLTDSATGALVFAGCHSGDASTGGCTRVQATSASASGLGMIETLAASPDGRSLYSGSATADALTRFDRATPPPGSDGPRPSPKPPAAARCPTVTPTRARGLRSRERPRRRRAGIRVRVRLDRAGQAKIVRARLTYGRVGRRRSLALAPARARARPRGTLRLRVPRRARIARGANVRVRVTVRARAMAGCRFGPKRSFTVRAKVV
jgi:DNA-binding beta-propeller fold protein YncE